MVKTSREFISRRLTQIVNLELPDSAHGPALYFLICVICVNLRLMNPREVFTIVVPRTDEQAWEIEDLIADSDITLGNCRAKNEAVAERDIAVGDQILDLPGLFIGPRDNDGEDLAWIH